MQTLPESYIPIAHDGDWYYLAAEDQLEQVLDAADRSLNSHTVIGRAFAARKLSKLISFEIDIAIDDTDLFYSPSPSLSRRELASEILMLEA